MQHRLLAGRIQLEDDSAPKQPCTCSGATTVGRAVQVTCQIPDYASIGVAPIRPARKGK
jgi:hypothetical protein